MYCYVNRHIFCSTCPPLGDMHACSHLQQCLMELSVAFWCIFKLGSVFGFTYSIW